MIASWAVCHIGLTGSIGVHDIDLPVSVSIGVKRDTLPIGRPGRAAVVEGVVGQVRQPGTVCVHYIDLKVTILSGVKREALSIRGPNRAFIESCVIRETRLVPTVRVHNVDREAVCRTRGKGNVTTFGGTAQDSLVT